jgi:hypothetical protein
MTSSPYAGLAIDKWEAKTRELIDLHPLGANLLYDLVLHTWSSRKLAASLSKLGKIYSRNRKLWVSFCMS